MDRSQKTTELAEMLESSRLYSPEQKIGKDERTYAGNGKFVRFHDVSTGGVFYGFVPVQVPNPSEDYDTQLEALMDIYTTEQIVKSCIKSIVIDLQQEARKTATGATKKMSDAEFAAAWDKLTTEQPEILSRLKTYEHISNHIRDEWLEQQVEVTDGTCRLF